MIFQESITTAGSPILLFMVNLLSVMIQLTYKPVASFRVLHPGHSKKKNMQLFPSESIDNGRQQTYPCAGYLFNVPY